jgi:TPR repeat protein
MVWFEKAAEQGYPLAFRALGKFNAGKRDGLQSNSKAFRYFQDGANLGDPVCLYLLGVCYYNGEGVDMDIIKGFEYLAIAYHQVQQHQMKDLLGSVCSMLGVAYYEGALGNQSLVLTKYYLEKTLKLNEDKVYLSVYYLLALRAFN